MVKPAYTKCRLSLEPLCQCRCLHADLSLPAYGGHHARHFDEWRSARPLITTPGVQHGIVGDTYIAVHVHTPPFAVAHHRFYETISCLVIAPTGSVTDGVGASKTTFNVTDHLEMGGRLSPYLNLGIGSSSRVQNRRLQQDQTSRGMLANFAAGLSIALQRQWDFAAEVFKQLPIGPQNISQTEARPGGAPGTQQTVVSSGLAENNGLNTALNIPLAPHFTLSGYYSRSLRRHEDIAGFSITFLLRPAQAVR